MRSFDTTDRRTNQTKSPEFKVCSNYKQYVLQFGWRSKPPEMQRQKFTEKNILLKKIESYKESGL
jgi:hypothetical protein